MKKFTLTIALISFVATSVFSQQQDNIDRLESLENGNQIQNENQSEDKNANDAVEINLGKRTISIEESDNKTYISISKKETPQKNANRFRGHLGGIGFGFNGLLTDFWSTSLNAGDEYFDINSSKSFAWNFTCPGVNIGITKHFGFVSSVGFTLNSYRFNNNNSITKGSNGIVLHGGATGVIVPLYPLPGIVYKKSVFRTAYVNIPVMLELQIPANGSYNKTVNISGGVVGAVKLWSKTKVVWNDNGKRKAKDNSDFNLNLLRWGTTARIGYDNFQVYGTTYFTPMFQKGKGPELYPFEVGVAFTF